MFELDLTAGIIAASFVALALAGLLGLDGVVVRWSERAFGRPTFADQLFRLFSATPLVVTVLFFMPAIYLFTTEQPTAAVALAAACSLALGAAFTIKYLIGRQRPLGHLTYIGKVDSSFPSAHSAGSFAAAFMLAYIWPEFSWLAFGLAGLVALSRIYLQLHFLSDIAGGILLAYLFSLFVIHSDFLEFFNLV
jgi:undecaprenyl-diphosphatase